VRRICGRWFHLASGRSDSSDVENVIKIICPKIYLSHFYSFCEENP
jgi:hypothetical protein